MAPNARRLPRSGHDPELVREGEFAVQRLQIFQGRGGGRRVAALGLRRDVMAVFAEGGIPALVTGLGAARKRLAEVDDRLDALDDERMELERALAELASGRDARTQAVIEAAARELRALGSGDLLTASHTTDSSRDDDIVAEITDIRTRSARALDRANARTDDRARAGVSMELGREVTHRFRAHGLELRDFAFADTSEIQPLFDGIASGTLDLEGAWSWLVKRVADGRCGSTWIGDTSGADEGFDLADLFRIFGGGGLSGGASSGSGGFGLDDFVGGILDGEWFDTGGDF